MMTQEVKEPVTPSKPVKFEEKEILFRSSPLPNGYESESEEEGIDIVESLERKAKARSDSLYKPMSSPIRGERRSGKGGFQSRSLRAKYTLRTRQYVPFQQRQREERRSKAALDRRGGADEMERYVQDQGYRRGINKLNEEANTHMFKIEEMNEGLEMDHLAGEDPQVMPYQDTVPHQYVDELEEMLRMEEEELEALTANLTLDY